MPGKKIGNIRVLEPLASGGMSRVFVGFDEKLQRLVALKTIRSDRLSQEAKARFLREARILSKLDHSRICRIYDYLEGDESDLLVLELVDGKTLRQLRDDGLDPALRMRIAEELAEVLEVAHGKGVIHRDLKPANVMLTADNQIKVLDFGLAYASTDDSGELQEPAPGMDGPAAEKDSDRQEEEAPEPMTTHGQVMGTVAYMSPEQARGERATSASDIYSFGLILQELFTGKAPYRSNLRGSALLLEVAAGKSLPVTGIDSDLASLINRMKSLEPAARPSSREAAERLRWIRHKPRRRLRWAAAVVTVLAVVLAAVKYTTDLRRERNQAIAARHEAEQARSEAELARREAEQVVEFLVGLFRSADPQHALGETSTARELLDEGARRIGQELAEQPLVKARLLGTIGSAYNNLGLYSQATQLLESSLQIREQICGPESPDVAVDLYHLAVVYELAGRYGDAEPLFRRALEIRQMALPPEHDDLIESLNGLGVILDLQGRDDEAEPLYREVLEIRERTLEPNHPDVAISLNNLGLLLMDLQSYDEAAALLQRALQIQRRNNGPKHPLVIDGLYNLAICFHWQERLDEAERFYREAIALAEEVLGPEHPDVGYLLSGLASLAADLDRNDEAEQLYRRSRAVLEKALGTEHPEVGNVLNGLARLAVIRGEPVRAEELYRRSLAIFSKTLAPQHPTVADTMQRMAELLQKMGRLQEANRYQQMIGKLQAEGI